MHIDFSRIHKVHVIGIKGSGIVAIVQFLVAMDKQVSGSDTEEKFFTEEVLRKLGVNYEESFSPENIPQDADLVIYSTAYTEENNIEFQEAKRRGMIMISYPEILGQLFNQKYGIAVCGTHGKSTTTAMLATAMKRAGADPSAIVGTKVIEWGENALVGTGEYLIAEADEFQNKLRFYNPKAVVLTSADWDHPDCFPDFDSYKQVFKDFVAKIPKTGFLVVWGDSIDTLEILESANCEIIRYGFLEENDVVIVREGNSQKFRVTYREKDLGEFETKLIGEHNILNAAATIAVCQRLNLYMESVREALLEFRGTARRFEYIGQYRGATLIDDYAHHPDEIKPTLKGAREIYPDKTIWAIFHPHTYTRTKALLSEFSQSFSDADKVIILDIYGSARETQGGVSSEELVELINKYQRWKAEHIPTISEAVEFLKDKIGENDVVITIGAGNGWEIVEKLKNLG